MTARTTYTIGAGALAALLGSFAAGRYTAKPQVVTKTEVRTDVQYRDVVHTQLVHDVQTVHDVATKTVTVTQWKTAPGGVVTVTQQATTDRAAETKRQDHAQGTRDEAVASHAQTVELRTVTPVRPAWSVSLMPGAQLLGSKAVTLWGPLVVGASVEHRFIGPVSLGIWASTSGAAGITLRGDL